MEWNGEIKFGVAISHDNVYKVHYVHGNSVNPIARSNGLYQLYTVPSVPVGLTDLSSSIS